MQFLHQENHDDYLFCLTATLKLNDAKFNSRAIITIPLPSFNQIKLLHAFQTISNFSCSFSASNTVISLCNLWYSSWSDVKGWLLLLHAGEPLLPSNCTHFSTPLIVLFRNLNFLFFVFYNRFLSISPLSKPSNLKFWTNGLIESSIDK